MEDFTAQVVWICPPAQLPSAGGALRGLEERQGGASCKDVGFPSPRLQQDRVGCKAGGRHRWLPSEALTHWGLRSFHRGSEILCQIHDRGRHVEAAIHERQLWGIETEWILIAWLVVSSRTGQALACKDVYKIFWVVRKHLYTKILSWQHPLFWTCLLGD